MTGSISKKILVVDDDLGTIKLLEKWLGVAGYQILSSSSGKSAVMRAKNEQPDLILLDILIKDASGIELARMFQSDPIVRKIPIIFMTAYIGVENDKGDEEIEVEGQFYRIFAKPLHNQKLLSEIRKTINRVQNS